MTEQYVGSFLAGAHRELSVALIKCQGSVYRGCGNLLARAADRLVLPGAKVPYVDYMSRLLILIVARVRYRGRLWDPVLLSLIHISEPTRPY